MNITSILDASFLDGLSPPTQKNLRIIPGTIEALSVSGDHISTAVHVKTRHACTQIMLVRSIDAFGPHWGRRIFFQQDLNGTIASCCQPTRPYRKTDQVYSLMGFLRMVVVLKCRSFYHDK